MGWNPKLIFYSCVAKGPTVLAEYTSSSGRDKGSDGLELVARRCIERTPQNHSNFSHTVRKRSYTFLIDDSFAYFVISHEDLGVGEALRFLNRVREAFRGGFGGFEGVGELIELCLQVEMGDSFRDLLGLDGFHGGKVMGSCCLMGGEEEEGKERNEVGGLLHVSPRKVLVKKKKRFFGGGEANGDGYTNCVGVDGDCGNVVNKNLSNVDENENVKNVVLCREFSVTMLHKGGNGGGVYIGDQKQKAKQIWRKHVWVVLVLDLVVCATLFGIWLCVCRGFKCIDG